MNLHKVILFSVFLALLFSACRSSIEVDVTVTAEPAAAPVKAANALAPAPTIEAVPTAFLSATPELPATILPTATPEPTATPSPTADPYAAYTIETLAERSYGGGELRIEETLERTDTFARYAITYPSDGLEISGFMNVPHDGSQFPVVIMLHGYIAPQQYETLDYTTRYADALAEAGYFVIHPNLRNFPPSDKGPDVYRTGLAEDVLNLIAIVRAQSLDAEGPLRRADREHIHLWGHSMGGGVALRVLVVNNADYIQSAVLYGAMSGNERLNYERIREWSGGERGDFELAASEQALEAISPLDHLERIKAPISIHHGSADETVPPEWSQELCQELEKDGFKPQCFVYEGAGHTFAPPWDDLFKERVRQFFDGH